MKLLTAYFLGVIHTIGVSGTVQHDHWVYPVMAVVSGVVMLGLIINELYKRK